MPRTLQEVTNDEETFVARLAKAATDLRVEDWDDDTVDRFKENLAMYKRLQRNSKTVSLKVKTVLQVLMKSDSAVMMVHQK